MSFAKFKDYPFTLKNAKKTGLFRMEATFNSHFLETYTDFQISTHGKWKIDLLGCQDYNNTIFNKTTQM